MAIKSIIFTALKTLKEDTFGFWEPCNYGSCFDEKGELNLAQLKKIAPQLTATSSREALDQIQGVLSAYEKKYWFEKLWFRWTQPHPIDIYYRLDEISVLQELSKAIREDGETLTKAGWDAYEKSRLSSNITWLDKLTGGVWNMMDIAHKQAKISVAEMLIEKNMAETYNDFKSKSIRYIALAVTHAVDGPDVIFADKKAITQTGKAALLSMKNHLDSTELSERIINLKNTYSQSMRRWETFAHDCCDILSGIPPQNIHHELQKKAELQKVKLKWEDDIFQHANVIKKKLTTFFAGISQSVSDKLKAWANFEEDSKQHLVNSCSLYQSSELEQNQTKDAVLGLCYQAHIHEQQLRTEFAIDELKIKEKQQQEAKIVAQARQTQENIQELALYNASSEITDYIKYASNENLLPDEIPELIKKLAELLNKTSEPEEQVNLFSKILLWQNRYLEAASWHCTSEIHNIAALAKQHLQFAKELFSKLALQLHSDKVPTQKIQHMQKLIERRNSHNNYISYLLNTCFDALRRQTPWQNRIWEAGGKEKIRRGVLESERQEIEVLKAKIKLDMQEINSDINKVEEAINKLQKATAEGDKTQKKLDKELEDGRKKLDTNQQILDRLLKRMEAIEKKEDVEEQSDIMSSRVSGYLNGEAPRKYIPSLLDKDEKSLEPGAVCPNQEGQRILLKQPHKPS